MDNDILSFNGIDGSTGGYLLEVSQKQLVEAVVGESDRALKSELKARKDAAGEGGSHLGPMAGIDDCNLAETGWGVIFATTKAGTPEALKQEAIYDALRPLLALRKEQATKTDERFYKEFWVERTGYWKDDTKSSFLARQKVGSGPANPAKVPYYLLIVGDPSTIPFSFQSQLGVTYAVGRLHFDQIEDYAHYAASVVAVETGGLALPRRATFFGVCNDDDRATRASDAFLVTPLAEKFAKDKNLSDWTIEGRRRERATRASLDELINGGNTPALLFTGSHGMGFPKGDPNQEPHGGALLCQDWPGPKNWKGKIPEDFYFSGKHVSANADLRGSIAFLFACFGAGTPELDEFYKKANKDRAPIANRPFVGSLPKALLNRPKGGALAVVGHVDRAWGYSFLTAGTGEGGAEAPQLETFESTLLEIMGGTKDGKIKPIGAAMEYFDQRYAELSTDLTRMLEEQENNIFVDPNELVSLWTANNDARGYAILGDPAVRLPLAVPGQSPVARSALVAIAVTQSAPSDSAPRPVATEAVPPPTPAAPPEPAPSETRAVAPQPRSGQAEVPSFGVSDWFSSKEQTAEKPASTEPGALQSFLTRLGETLRDALKDATELEVSTYVTGDLGQAKPDGKKMVGAELRAFTRVSLDGDTLVCLPEKDGAVDTEVWEIHLAMVKQAQETRAELMKMLVSAAASLAGLGK